MTTLLRITLALLLAVSLSASASDKKGIGIAALNAGDRVAAMNVGWYYTWKPAPIEGAPQGKFVPMISGRANRLENELGEVRSRGKVPLLLALNEPDHTDQANMNVDEAARIWPQLAGLAGRVSSPAVAGGNGPWLKRFMGIARQRGFKVDFLALHIYGPPDAAQFLKRLDAIHAEYNLPVWITEFAVADWKSKGQPGANRFNEAQVLAFMQAVLPELERRPWVERYAWFGAGPRSLEAEPVRTSRLFEKDGSLTPLGKFYANFR